MFRVLYQQNKASCRGWSWSQNSRSFSAKIYFTSMANTWITPVGAIHLTKSKGRTSVHFQTGCRKFFENILLTDNFIVTVYHLSYICGKRHSHKWRESGNFWKNYMTNFRQTVPIFATRFTDVFADVEAPGDESGKH